jgi:hypothetical protein
MTRVLKVASQALSRAMLENRALGGLRTRPAADNRGAT